MVPRADLEKLTEPNPIISGSIGPMFDMGWSTRGKHDSDLIRAMIAAAPPTPSTEALSVENERLRAQNERLLDALTHFGCYPDEWDGLPERTRLELRIEQPASKWATAHVTWRISELKRAKDVLVQYHKDARALLPYEAAAREHSSHPGKLRDDQKDSPSALQKADDDA
jgi:hypothetical protein